MAIAELIRPATSQDNATVEASCLPDKQAVTFIPNKAAMQSQANRKGVTGGEGPGAKGLSQGRLMAKIASRHRLMCAVCRRIEIIDFKQAITAITSPSSQKLTASDRYDGSLMTSDPIKHTKLINLS